MRSLKNGFTLVDLLITVVAVSVIILLVALLLPAFDVRHHGAPKMTNSMRLRGIHQGMVNYAQGHKLPDNDGVFPGLSVDLTTYDEPFAASSTNTYGSDERNGAFAAHRYAVLLNSGFVTPEYLIAPPDGDAKTPVQTGHEVTTTNYSYAMLQLDSTPRRTEWSERINGMAPMLCDRLIGSLSKPSSIWTEAGSGEWEGTVVFNDNSAQHFSRTSPDTEIHVPVIEATRYADMPTVAKDHLFIAEGDHDAAMIYSTDSVSEYAQ